MVWEDQPPRERGQRVFVRMTSRAPLPRLTPPHTHVSTLLSTPTSHPRPSHQNVSPQPIGLTRIRPHQPTTHLPTLRSSIMSSSSILKGVCLRIMHDTIITPHSLNGQMLDGTILSQLNDSIAVVR